MYRKIIQNKEDIKAYFYGIGSKNSVKYIEMENLKTSSIMQKYILDKDKNIQNLRRLGK